MGLSVLGNTGLFGCPFQLIRSLKLAPCLAAFRHNNWLGLTVWVGIVLALAVR